MGNINDLILDVYEANKRFEEVLVDGEFLSEAQIEFIKVYEEATGQRFYVTKENMYYLNKYIAGYDIYGQISSIGSIVTTYHKAGCLYQEGQHYEAYKEISKFT